MTLKESLKTLKFDSILEAIAGHSNSVLSREEILEISPLDSREKIDERFGRIQEVRRLSAGGAPLQLAAFQDITQPIEKIRPVGAVIEATELLAFIPVLRIIHDISVQLGERNDLPLLKEFAGRLTGFPGILKKLERAIDYNGKLFDNASPELFRLRSSIRSLDTGISRRIEEIIRHKKITPFLQDSFVTKRAERWVIPVRMDSKGQVRGVVHDVSRSGETAYIEPLEIIGLTNELENLIADEKTEQIRILRDICSSIREEAHEITHQFRTIVCLDVLNSIAEFADLLKMNVPEINNDFFITLKGARHPLLLLLQKQAAAKEVVPLDISLGGDRVIVITGPNAGGKTIAIKTVGLLLLMALSGVPVPADAASSFPLVNELLIDIGDEQSIENSLSTFSAHISNISGILKKADSSTIVLIDELGTGTEPAQGAAIACAVLKNLKEKGSLVLATTHLTEIVGFVHKTEGMINASMEFDKSTVAPLYKLLVGEPGESHALDIAGRYGLPEEVLASAKELLGGLDIELQGLISELKEKRALYEEAFHNIELRKQNIEKTEMSLKDALAGNERRKREILEEAYSEAKELLASVKREAKVFLEEVKREKKRESVKNIEQARLKVEEKLEELRKDTTLTIEDIKEGDMVFARSIGYDVPVLGIDLKQRRLRVRAGNMYMELPVSDISLRQGRIPAIRTDNYKGDEEEDFVPSSLNIIGLRVEEALSRLEPFLNHASLSGFQEVTVIHGVGTGALLKAVRDHLNGHPLVTGFRSGEQFEGGSGVTIIRMR